MKHCPRSSGDALPCIPLLRPARAGRTGVSARSWTGTSLRSFRLKFGRRGNANLPTCFGSWSNCAPEIWDWKPSLAPFDETRLYEHAPET